MGPRLGLRWRRLNPVFCFSNHLLTSFLTKSFYSTAFGEFFMLLENEVAKKMIAKQHCIYKLVRAQKYLKVYSTTT